MSRLVQNTQALEQVRRYLNLQQPDDRYLMSEIISPVVLVSDPSSRRLVGKFLGRVSQAGGAGAKCRIVLRNPTASAIDVILDAVEIRVGTGTDVVHFKTGLNVELTNGEIEYRDGDLRAQTQPITQLGSNVGASTGTIISTFACIADESIYRPIGWTLPPGGVAHFEEATDNVGLTITVWGREILRPS